MDREDVIIGELEAIAEEKRKESQRENEARAKAEAEKAAAQQAALDANFSEDGIVENTAPEANENDQI
jgi:hypothetical protein